LDVGEKSLAIPSAIVVEGKIMLLNAAIEPLIPTKKIMNTPARIAIIYFF